MKMPRHVQPAVVLLVMGFHVVALSGERALVVAHRGASGYLPEHTLAAKALSHGMGADFIEQDVVLTKDDHPIVLHDVCLDTVTNVADRFPGRARKDGRFYAVDFSLNEVQALRVTERIDVKTRAAVYPRRFPLGRSHFQVPTLAEEIELIQGLNRSTGRDVGIYTEIKSPAWHRAQGKDVGKVVLEVLGRYGYRDRRDQAYVQCFDPAELKRVRHELNSRLRLVQLIGKGDGRDGTTDFDRMRTIEGLEEVAGYAEGIGPEMSHVVAGRDDQGKLIFSSLVKDAHRQGLVVHPYTFRADSLPEYAASFEELLRLFLREARVDGLFTDFPDRAVAVRDRLHGMRNRQ